MCCVDAASDSLGDTEGLACVVVVSSLVARSVEVATHLASQMLACDIACGGAPSLLSEQPGIEEAS